MRRKYCKCGCGDYAPHGSKKFIDGHRKIWEENGSKLCECGCGEITSPGSRFIHGHNARGLIRTPEQRERLSLALSSSTKLAEAMIGNKNGLGHRYTEEWKENMSERLVGNVYGIGCVHTEEWKEAARHRAPWNKGLKLPPHTEETKAKMSRSRKWYWTFLTEDEKIDILKRREICSKRNGPNKPENILLLAIQHLGFEFVGDGKLWIGEFNPDFVHKAKKVIVEMFGNYWHQNSAAKDKVRLNSYRNAGYTPLVVWEKDLYDNQEKQVSRIASSTGVGI